MTTAELIRQLGKSVPDTVGNRILRRLLAELGDKVRRDRDEINCMGERED